MGPLVVGWLDVWRRAVKSGGVAIPKVKREEVRAVKEILIWIYR